MLSYHTILGPTTAYFAWSLTDEQIDEFHDRFQIICKYIMSPYDNGTTTPITNVNYSAYIEDGNIKRMHIIFTSDASDEHKPRFQNELVHTLAIHVEKHQGKIKFFESDSEPMYNPPNVFLNTHE